MNYLNAKEKEYLSDGGPNTLSLYKDNIEELRALILLELYFNRE